MTLRFLILTLSICFFTCSSIAQKFAFVDSEYILDQMGSYQKAQKQIDDLASQWQKELDAKSVNIEQKINNSLTLNTYTMITENNNKDK